MKTDRLSIPLLPSLSGITSRIGSNIFWSGVSEVGGKGLVFVATMYLARALGAEGFGVFNFGLTLTMYFWLAVDLGTNMYGAREIAKNRDKKDEILNTILSMRIASGIAAFIVFVLITYALTESPAHRLVYLGFSFYLVFRALYTEWYLRGVERLKSIAFCNLVAYGALVLLLYVFVRGPEDLAASAFIWSLVFLIGGALFLWAAYYKQPGVSFRFVLSPRKWLDNLGESIHFVISGGLSSLYQGLPIIILGIAAGSYDVGIYSSAHRIVFAAIFVLSVPLMAIYPVLSDFHKNDPSGFKRLFHYSSIVMITGALACTALLYVLSPETVRILLGSGFDDAVPVLRILSGFFFLRVIREIFVIALSSAGLQRFYSLASVFSVVFMLGAFPFLVYVVGADMLTSASVSMIITEAGVLLIMLAVWRRKVVLP